MLYGKIREKRIKKQMLNGESGCKNGEGGGERRKKRYLRVFGCKHVYKKRIKDVGRKLLNGVASGGGFGTYQERGVLGKTDFRYAGFCHDSAKIKRVWLCTRCSRICPPTKWSGFGRWVRYVSGTWVLGKTDFSPTKRGGFGGWVRYVSEA